MLKKGLNPLCEMCGLPFVRSVKRKVKCNDCTREEQRIYQKEYHKNRGVVNG